MSKLASKLSKRIMAIVLSVAMVMPNMTVYASEQAIPQTVDEAVTDVDDSSVPQDGENAADMASDPSDEAIDNTDGNTDEEGQTPETGEEGQAPDTGEEGQTPGEEGQTPGTEDEETGNPDDVTEAEEPDKDVVDEEVDESNVENNQVSTYALTGRTEWVFANGGSDWTGITNFDYVGEKGDDNHYKAYFSSTTGLVAEADKSDNDLILYDVKKSNNFAVISDKASSKISIPVTGADECLVEVTYNYAAKGVQVGNNVAHDDTTDTRVYLCEVANGTVDITLDKENGGQTYIEKIAIAEASYDSANVTEWSNFDITNGDTGYKGLELSNVTGASGAAVVAAGGKITVPANESGKLIVTFDGTPAVKIDGKDVKVSDNKAVYKYTYADVSSSKKIEISASAETKITSIKKEVTEWNFAASDWTTDTAKYASYKGLVLSAVSRQADQEGSAKPYAIMKTNSTIKIPVSGKTDVTVYGSYHMNGTVGVGNDTKALTTDKATAGVTYTYNGTGDGYVEIKTTTTEEDSDPSTYLTKIVVAPEIPSKVTVSGTVTKPADATGLSLVFTDSEGGTPVTAAIAESGAYSAELDNGHTYTISVSDNQYEIATTDGSELSLVDNDEAAVTMDIAIQLKSQGGETYAITGEIKGLEAEAIDALSKLKFVGSGDSSDEVEAELTKAEGKVTYSAQLKENVEYTIKAEGINEYCIDTSIEGNTEKISISEASTHDITYVKKPAYRVTLETEGASLKELEKVGAKITFTDVNNEGYEFTYDIKEAPKGDDIIKLRDGTYSVSVTNSGAYVQQTTPNLRVSGRSAVKKIVFKVSDTIEWDFSDESFQNAAAEEIAEGWKGLKFNSVDKDTQGYAKMNGDGSTIQIPIDTSKNLNITVTYSNKANAKFENEDTPSISTADGKADKHTAVYTYTAKSNLNNAGYLTLKHVTAQVDNVNVTETYISKIQVKTAVLYGETLKVGKGADYDFETINDALDAVRKMSRTNDQVVTISIQPGNYEEMLVIDVDNVRLVNAAENPSTALKNSGVNIDANAVRITSYYGEGYNYFSMGSDYKWNEDVLKANLRNGSASTQNSGNSYSNATVVIDASNVTAEGIIFENSFNQYVSKKASEDEIVKGSNANEGSVARADLPEGSTAVQDKAYAGSAAALAIAPNNSKVFFDNCKFVGRQDTLYGGNNAVAAFYGCSVYGSTDYIQGSMTAVFAKCDLVFNTSEDDSDVGYITSAQTPASSRGFLMYNCHIKAAVPGVDTASASPSKPGFLGNPGATTGEAVFYKTLIDAADSYWWKKNCDVAVSASNSQSMICMSLIFERGWASINAAVSERSQEYGTYEYACERTLDDAGEVVDVDEVDNSAARADGKVLTDAEAEAITVAAFLGEWDAFDGKDMDIVIPAVADKVDNKFAKRTKPYVLQANTIDNGLVDKVELPHGTKLGDKDYYTVYTTNASAVDDKGNPVLENGSILKGTVVKRNGSSKIKALEINKWSSAAIQFKVQGTADVELQMCSTGGSNTSRVALVHGTDITDGEADYLIPVSAKDNDGKDVEVSENGLCLVYGNQETPTTITYENLEAGTYSIVSPYHKDYNRGAWLVKATVRDTVDVEITNDNYELYAREFANGTSDNEPIVKGTQLDAKKYYSVYTGRGSIPSEDDDDDASSSNTETIDGSVKKINGANSKLKAWEIEKWSSAGIQFRVKGTADIELLVSSNGANNSSRVALINASDNTIQKARSAKTSTDADISANPDGSYIVSGDDTTPSTLIYRNIPEGRYMIVSPYDAANDRGVWLIKATSNDTFDKTGDDDGDGDDQDEITPWADVKAPKITAIAIEKDKNGKEIESSVEVKIDAVIGNKGGDELVVEMTAADDAEGKVLDSQTTVAVDSTHTMTFSPDASGTYKFKAILSRIGEKDERTDEGTFEFTLPLTAPNITSVTNKGKVEGYENEGSVEVEWTEVKEATSYTIKVAEILSKSNNGSLTLDNANAKEYTITPEPDKDLIYTITGLTIGKDYAFTMKASNDTYGESAESKAFEKSVKDTSEVKWSFATYGASISTADDGFEENSDGSVRVYSLNGKGKIVPNSTDGIAYYYTRVDNPEETNFKLSAMLHVNNWTYSNGQDGFGLLASDRVGVSGDGDDFWTNSYMAVATKCEYYWNRDAAEVATEGDRVSLRLGIGSMERYGVTKENLAQFEDKTTVAVATKNYFKTSMRPLDTTIHKGQYTIIGNYTPGSLGTNILPADNMYTDIYLEIEKNNTGYFISYAPALMNSDGTVKTDADGNVMLDNSKAGKNKYYKDYNSDKDKLCQIRDDAIYVGLFAARNADITFSDIKLTTSVAANDPQAEEQDVTKLPPNYSVTSGATSNSEEYELIFNANWQGNLTVRDDMGNLIIPDASSDDPVVKTGRVDGIKNEVTGEYTKTYNLIKKKVKLNIGNNTFKVSFVPDKFGDEEGQYNPDPNPNYKAGTSSIQGFTELTNYESQAFTFNVTYKAYGKEGQALYVSPIGTATGTGSRVKPLDIYTAVKYVQPGQTIYLMEGTYNLTKTVKIDRGINGTADKLIYMIPDPEAVKRPVLNFSQMCEGIVLAGNYWYLKGFDVTGSASGKDGIRVSGSNNTLERMNTYMNGNTGIQISRYLGTDLWDDWPSNNLILNCTSYLNADSGYEDADGFAAKLTIADGNVFDGCIAAYNADDGWDLFAKVETDSIGSVIIKNSIAYRNGYVLTVDGKKYSQLDINGIPVEAGNGNGFKMGGSSLPSGNPSHGDNGHHTLINSAAFYNRAKGIDSNSCPDIQVKDSISFNNESYNIAFYSQATNTDFGADGLISFRTDFLGMEENLKLSEKSVTNTQDMTKLYKSGNYFWEVDNHNSFQRVIVDASDKTAIKYSNDESSKVKKSWFVSLDFDKFEKASKKTTTYADGTKTTDLEGLRYSDGTINMHEFLELTGIALTGGTVGDAQSADEVEVPDDVPATDGNISSGDAADETSGGVLPEDVPSMPTPGASGTVEGLWIADIDPELCGYTGKAVKPDVHVYEGTTLLKKGKDYTVSYRNNINAFVDEDTCKEEGIDYSAAYSNAASRKKVPTVIIRGKGNYIRTVEKTFNIMPVDLEDDSMNRVITSDMALAYNGKSQNVKPVVKFNTRKLTNNKDYTFTVKDSSGQDAGTKVTGASGVTTEYTVTLKGIGNFCGTKEISLKVVGDKKNLASSFKIVGKLPNKQRRGYDDPANSGIGDPLPVEFTDEEFTSYITVKNKSGEKLDIGKDYYISGYKNNIEIGTATLCLTGKDTYAGTKELSFRIVKPQLNAMVNGMLLDRQNKVYRKLSIHTADSPAGTEYDFRHADPMDYAGAPIKIFDEKNLVISVTDKYTKTSGSTGTAPQDSWSDLVEDRDYKLVYRNNNRAGTASVVIKGIGNYSGSISRTFKIRAYDISVADDAHYAAIGGSFARYTSAEAGNGITAGNYKDNIEVTAEKSGNRPSVLLTINGQKMKQGKDYTVVYRYNTWLAQHISKRTPTIIITGRGALKGRLTKTFSIERKQLDDSENPISATAEDIRVAKSGREVTLSPVFVLKDSNNRRMAAGTDYDRIPVSYTWDVVSDGVNDGGSITKKGNKWVVKLDTDTTVLEATAKIGAVTEGSKGNRCSYAGAKEVTFKIGLAKRSLRGATVVVNYNSQEGYTGTRRKTFFDYTAEEIRLFHNSEDGNVYNTITVTLRGVKGADGRPVTLKYGEDFEIVTYSDGSDSYKNNIKRGTASVIIRGIGNYSGTRVIKYRIGTKDFSEVEWLKK